MENVFYYKPTLFAQIQHGMQLKEKLIFAEG